MEKTSSYSVSGVQPTRDRHNSTAHKAAVIEFAVFFIITSPISCRSLAHCYNTSRLLSVSLMKHFNEISFRNCLCYRSGKTFIKSLVPVPTLYHEMRKVRIATDSRRHLRFALLVVFPRAVFPEPPVVEPILVIETRRADFMYSLLYKTT